MTDELKIGIVTAIVAAIATGFAIFLFERIAEMLRRDYERKKLHYNALVKIENILNVYLDEIGINIVMIKGFKEALSKRSFSANKFTPFVLRDEFLVELADLDVINKWFSLQTLIGRINRSMETVHSIYLEIKTHLLDGKIDEAIYLENINYVATGATDLLPHLENLNEKTIRMLALVRVRTKKDKPLFTKIQEKLMLLAKKEVTEEELSEERKVLESEINKIQEESGEEIKKLTK